MRAKYAASLLLVSASLLGATVGAAPAQLPPRCERAISEKLPDWGPLAPPTEVAALARKQKFNPVVAQGDFDGNRSRDWATLVLSSGKPALVFCLNPAKRLKLLVVADPYCSDFVYRTPAHSWRYNYETGKEEQIAHDGASVSCFEHAGATYVLENSRVRRIIDSD
jgi:hypothetical protein